MDKLDGDAIHRAMELKWGRHHIWCNFYGEQHASVCTMCAGLKKDYPEDGRTPDELIKEHFPGVRKVNE